MKLAIAPGRLMLRLGNDPSIVSIDYSFDALYACASFLELPSELKANADTKRKLLQSLFELGYTSHKGLKGLNNSFLHPICFDAMKYLGDSLQAHQIGWLIENVPGAIFDNLELLINLKDYSFLTLEIYDKSIIDYKAISSVDFLAIPAFVKTGPTDLLLVLLSTVFEPSRHWNILLENRGLEELLKDQQLRENPHFYPFFLGIASSEYLADATDITGTIRKHGLRNLILASLISYVQATNDIIQSQMTEIATVWADLHKNSHLTISADINKEFNERIKPAVELLSLIKKQREDVNDLMKEFEEGKISVHHSIISECPNWLDSLKVLVQTPFNEMMRLTFITRYSMNLFAPIHPDDEDNLVKLPRLITPNSNPDVYGIYMQPNPAYIFHPLIWSSLWRSVFCKVDNDPSTNPGISNLDDDGNTNCRLKMIYRDSNVTCIDLIGAWMNLAAVLPEIFSKGPRLLSFIASISTPAPPEGFQLPEEKLNERKEFAAKVIDAVSEIRLVDIASVEIIKFNLMDSEEVVKAMNELSQIVPNGPYALTFSIQKLELFCANFNSLTKLQRFHIHPDARFEYLTTIDTSFVTLGTTLTEAQIKELGESDEIIRLLARNGRALSRSQVTGLLQSESGRLFLKSNKQMLASLLDYSSFKPGDFEDLGIDIDEIRLNLATAPAPVKLLNLAKRGFSTFDDPVTLVHSLGYSIWAVKNSFKNLGLWELLNPVVLAYDLAMTNEFSLIQHIADLKHKLHENVLLNLALVFVTKWLIAQDWYAFVYHVAIGKGPSIFRVNMIHKLNEIYPKYLTEGETLGRKYLNEWLQNAEQGRKVEGKDEEDDVAYALAGLSVAVDAAPLTPFREIINRSTSNVSELLAKPFISSSHSPSLLGHVQTLIMNHFKSNDKIIWLNRLEILSQFSPETGKLKNSSDSSALARSRLSSLPTFDALIYKWALELEGVCVESIFRDTERGNLEIDSTAPGVVPTIQLKKTEAKTGVAKETKNKNKKNKKKK